jgi:hypothetical protein
MLKTLGYPPASISEEYYVEYAVASHQTSLLALSAYHLVYTTSMQENAVTSLSIGSYSLSLPVWHASSLEVWQVQA